MSGKSCIKLCDDRACVSGVYSCYDTPLQQVTGNSSTVPESIQFHLLEVKPHIEGYVRVNTHRNVHELGSLHVVGCCYAAAI